MSKEELQFMFNHGYNRSTDKWLKDNQKKYGYIYKNTRVRVKSEK